MKKFLPPFFLFACVSFFTYAQISTSNSQASSAKAQELILYMPHVDKSKTLQDVISLVQAEKYIVPVAFCDDLKCLLLRIDGNHSEKLERILQNFKNAGIDFDIKSNATIQQVLNQSHDILNAETYWQ